MVTLEVLSLSINYLLRVWTICWQNLNQIVWFKMYKLLIFSIFLKLFFTKHWRLSPRRSYGWNNCWLETIYFKATFSQCSKNTLTLLVMLKAAPNMADPTSMKHSVSSLNRSICYSLLFFYFAQQNLPQTIQHYAFALLNTRWIFLCFLNHFFFS